MAYRGIMSDLIMKAVKESGVNKETGGHASTDERPNRKAERGKRRGAAHGRQHKNKPSARTTQMTKKKEKEVIGEQKKASQRAQRDHKPRQAKHTQVGAKAPPPPKGGGKGGKP